MTTTTTTTNMIANGTTYCLTITANQITIQRADSDFETLFDRHGNGDLHNGQLWNLSKARKLIDIFEARHERHMAAEFAKLPDNERRALAKLMFMLKREHQPLNYKTDQLEMFVAALLEPSAHDTMSTISQ